MRRQNLKVSYDSGQKSVWRKSTFAYKVLYKYARFVYNLFYPVIHIEGVNNIPDGKPLIFAANHQNALMDALAILFAANRPVYFLARADIFKKKWIAIILEFLKMMPVYRLRDEVDIIKKNEITFQKTAEILMDGNYLGILPEGIHTPIKQIQTLKKGICRIAFDTLTMAGEELDLQIVPVGLDYSNYHKQGSTLVVIIGKAIAVADYISEYKENPNRAVTILRDKLSDSMKEIMINICSTEEYEFIYETSQLIANNSAEVRKIENPGERAWQHYLVVKRESERLVKMLVDNPSEYQEFKKYSSSEFNISNSEAAESAPEDKPKTIILKWAYAAFSWITILMNFLPFVTAAWFSKRIKDKQFISSVKYVVSLVLFPIWYVMLFLILLVTIGFLPAFGIVLIAVVFAILKLKSFPLLFPSCLVR